MMSFIKEIEFAGKKISLESKSIKTKGAKKGMETA